MFKLNPLTQKKLDRFKSIKRGYYSFIVFTGLVLASFFAECFVNNRALLVKYDGEYYFPAYSAMHSGEDFGEDYKYEAKYRDLKKKFEGTDNYVIMPLVPYNPYENDLDNKDGLYPPFAPSSASQHYLGTDTTGRDVLARLVYGFRTAIIFSLLLLTSNYIIGITIGCCMGFFGGKFDLFFQRIIEIWSNVPGLYVIIIISSIMIPNFFMLIGIMVFFGWMGMTWYMRTASYREKEREYVLAAKALGASNTRIIFVHIIPNSISIIVTFIPFSITGGITALTSLDYLGFGLPAPTPSWGELLQQGTSNLESIWIVSSVVVAMVMILFMVNLIGEAIREAFDPKKYTTYE